MTVTGISNNLSMKKKTVLQVLFILVFALILLRLRLPSFVPVANEYVALLYKRLMNGTLIVVFSLGMIQFTGMILVVAGYGESEACSNLAGFPVYPDLFYLTSPSLKKLQPDQVC
jgi:hypothetical protein